MRFRQCELCIAALRTLPAALADRDRATPAQRRIIGALLLLGFLALALVPDR